MLFTLLLMLLPLRLVATDILNLTETEIWGLANSVKYYSLPDKAREELAIRIEQIISNSTFNLDLISKADSLPDRLRERALDGLTKTIFALNDQKSFAEAIKKLQSTRDGRSWGRDSRIIQALLETDLSPKLGNMRFLEAKKAILAFNKGEKVHAEYPNKFVTTPLRYALLILNRTSGEKRRSSFNLVVGNLAFLNLANINQPMSNNERNIIHGFLLDLILEDQTGKDWGIGTFYWQALNASLREFLRRNTAKIMAEAFRTPYLHKRDGLLGLLMLLRPQSSEVERLAMQEMNDRNYDFAKKDIIEAYLRRVPEPRTGDPLNLARLTYEMISGGEHNEQLAAEKLLENNPQIHKAFVNVARRDVTTRGFLTREDLRGDPSVSCRRIANAFRVFRIAP